ncbi:MAG: hypothetical protein BAJALOKI2v1_1070003 [Promethearchaeota archaeon]|nr:MAG: hypothetical protein BAJALOKI2v1_1070003 [Candidatus Lokiarchaeota archaeon]
MVEICSECKKELTSCECDDDTLSNHHLFKFEDIKDLFIPQNGFYECICGEKLINKQYFFYHLMECQKNLFENNSNELYECACQKAFLTKYELMNHLHNNKMCLMKWKSHLESKH